MIVLTRDSFRVASYPAHSRSVTRFKQELRTALTSPLAFARFPAQTLKIIRQRQCLRVLHPLLEAVHAGWDISAPNAALSHRPRSREIERLSDWLKSESITPLEGITHKALQQIQQRAVCLARLPDRLEALLTSIEPKALSSATSGTVGYITHVDYPHAQNGYTRRSDAIVQALQKNDVNVHKICSREYIRTSIEDPDPSQGLLERIDMAARALARDIPEDVSEIIAASDWTNGWVALLAARYRGLRFAYEVRGQWQLTHAALVPGYEQTRAFKARTELEISLARQCEPVFCQTEPLAKYLGVETTSQIVPNGTFLNTERSNVQPTRTGALSLGYVGSLLKYEGLDMVIQAVVNLHKTYPHLSLTVIGDGPARRDLEQLCNALNAKDIVKIAGPVSPDEALRALRKFDAVVLPRRDDQVCHIVEPLKPLEALGEGKAVLATPLDVLKDFQGVLRSTSFEQADFEDMLKRCLKAPETLRQAGKSGHQWVLSNRMWSDVCRPMVRWIRSGA